MPIDRALPNQGLPGGSNPSIPDSGASSARGGTYFLGRYRVVDEIGIGGMASVHLARMDGPGGFQKWVAIKRIHPHLVEDEGFVHMFLDEARIAARISHPNVAQVFDLGKHEDTYWIAMEYLHGEPLREVMRRTEETGLPMPPEIACRVIADAAEGLHAAHELLGKNGEKLGLVHRDVTPHNLFVTYDGTTKVVDFGIAKFSSRMASTRAGTLKGKLAYMSPEQVAGESIDRRTDVFALGVVLWELTTGQRLFRMESDLDTLAKVQECNVPRPTQMVRGYPIDLEKIVMKALAKNKNERYRTARELSRALQSLLMKRGLFIASDEVAGYVTSIFQDRIQKREAHLRWAAEVTQTINIEGKLEPAAPAAATPQNEPSLMTYNSEVQPSNGTMRAVPRPAAGAPPPQLAQTGQSQATNPRPGALAANVDTVRPPGQQRTHGRAADPYAPHDVPTRNDRRPIPPAEDDHPGAEDPPTLARPMTRSERHPATDEPPTMRASPQALPPTQADDDFDDTDDTIVTSTRPEIADLRASKAPAPLPAAGRPAQRTSIAPPTSAVAAPPHSVPARVRTMAPLPAVVVPLTALSDGEDIATSVDEPVLPPPLIQRSPSLITGDVPGPIAAARSVPAGDAGRLFAPPPRNEARTITAASLRKRVPLWAYAAAAAILGLAMLTIMIIVIVRSTSKPVPAAASGGAAPVTAQAPTPLGPFGAARKAFAKSIETPGSANAPSPGSAPTTTAAATATTAATAAATATPTAAPTSKPLPAAAATAPAQDDATTAYGTLTVVCFPACDQVIDNGTPLGGSPFFARKVPVGSRRLQLVWSNPTTRKVISAIVVADQETRVKVSRE